MSAIIPFQFEAHAVRVQVDELGRPWFNATDVCDALEMGNPSQAIKSHVDTEDLQKLETLTAGGRQRQNHVNESGLYALILGSTKEAAKRFKRWVTSEVLPAIRKTGSYSSANTQPALPAPTQDCVSAILLMGDAVAKVPGVKPGIAMAATLTCIHRHRRAHAHPDRAIGHPVVPLDDLGAGETRMRHQVQLHDARPLDVVIRALVGLGFLIDQSRRFDAGDDEVAELAGLAVKRPNVPAQAGINQRKGNDDPLGLSAAHRVVTDGDGSLGVDCSANRCQHIHPGAAQSCRGFAGQQRLRLDVHSIAKSKSKRRQDTLRRVLEDRGERLDDTVDLVAAVEGDVLRRDFPVQRQVACRACRSHAEALNQVRATDLTEEVEPEVDVGQPLALGVAQALDALGVHGQVLLTHGR